MMQYENVELWIYDLCSETNMIRIFLGAELLAQSKEGIVVERKLKGRDMYWVRVMVRDEEMLKILNVYVHEYAEDYLQNLHHYYLNTHFEVPFHLVRSFDRIKSFYMFKILTEDYGEKQCVLIHLKGSLQLFAHKEPIFNLYR